MDEQPIEDEEPPLEDGPQTLEEFEAMVAEQPQLRAFIDKLVKASLEAARRCEDDG